MSDRHDRLEWSDGITEIGGCVRHAPFLSRPAEAGHDICADDRHRYNQSLTRMTIVPAEGDILERILDGYFEIWNEGLSRPRMANGIALSCARRGHDVICNGVRARRSRPGARDGQAVLLRHSHRRSRRMDVWHRGSLHAARAPPQRTRFGIVEALVSRARARRRAAGLLFSEIGAEFYERLGFTGVPLDEVTITVDQKGGAPAMLVRAGEERDLEAVAAMHAIGRPLRRLRCAAMRRSCTTPCRRSGLLAGLGPPGLRQLEFFVAEEGASAVAYVVLNVNANGWTLEEAGDRDPAGARLGAMLQVLLAREPSHGVPLIRAWWPRACPGAAADSARGCVSAEGPVHGAAAERCRDAEDGGRRLLLARRSFLRPPT